MHERDTGDEYWCCSKHKRGIRDSFIQRVTVWIVSITTIKEEKEKKIRMEAYWIWIVVAAYGANTKMPP